MKMIHMNVPDSKEATLEGYILDCKITFGQETKRPAVLVCPGGGYVYCSPREGEPVALAYASKGIHAFVLRYSTKFNAAGFKPLQEVSWAIGYIREHAQEWNIDPEKIAVCGFSAGGHLALSSGLLAENKPNAMILGYPAVQIPNLPGADYLLKVLTGKQTVTDQDSKDLSLVDKITKEAPPVFLVATAEDYLTSFGALPVVNRYSQLGLPYEAHIFQHGPHGYSTADVAAANGSEGLVNDSVAHWLQLSVDWMMRIFGKPVLTDKNVSEMAKHLKEMGITLPGA
jgi:acetyl esterase/lipase